MAKDDVLGIDFGDLLALEDEGTSAAATEDNKGEDKTPEPDTTDVDINQLLSVSDEDETKDEDPNDEIDDKVLETDDKDEDEEDSEDTEKTDDKKGSPDDKTKKEPFTLVYAKSLVDQGILSSINEEELDEIIKGEGEAAALLHIMNTEIDTRVKSVMDTYEEDFKEYAELKDLGFDSEKARQLVGDRLQLDKITDETLEQDENVRKNLLINYYKKTTKFNDTRINKLVENHIALGEDEETAKGALEELKEISKTELAEEKERIKQAEKNEEIQKANVLKDLKSKIQALDEVIPGHKINKPTKTKIEEMLLKPVKQDEQGNSYNAVWAKRMEDPFGFDTKLAYLIHTGVFDGKTDKLAKTAKSQALKSLEDNIRSSEGTFKTKAPRFEKEDEDLLKGLKGLV